MVRSIVFQLFCYSVLFVVPALAASDGVVISGDLRIIDGGSLVFADGSILKSATPPNPYSNIVTKTCNYSQLAPTGEGKCFCPAAPTGYKAIAIQGAAACNTDVGYSALESAGMMDDWYGGWCHYYNPDTRLTTGAVPQEVWVRCIYVPL
jgi:hypothetical protein